MLFRWTTRPNDIALWDTEVVFACAAMWEAKCAPSFALRFSALNKEIFDYLINRQFKFIVFDYLSNKFKYLLN